MSDQTALTIGETPGNLLTAIVSLAKDPAVDVEKLNALLSMQERLENRQAEAEFNRAFHEMEPQIPRIKRDGTLEYPVDKNRPDGPKRQIAKFAKWETIDASIRPILRQFGFSLSFNTAPRQGDGGGLVITGTLLHVAGHSKQASMPLPLDTSGGKNNLQGGGSTFSYGARYVTRMLLNIVTEGDDDDGVLAGIHYISDEKAGELRVLMKEAGRMEGPFLDRFFSGHVRSLEEIQTEQSYLAVKNTLNGILEQRSQKAKA